MNSDFEQIFEQAVELITIYGLKVIGAITILIVGWWIAGRVRSLVKRALDRVERADEMLTSFFSSTARYAVLVFTILAVLEQFGVETTSFIAVLGAAGLAIGLALQGTLSNVAAGVMIMIFRPFKVGDYIEGSGHAGTVKSVTLFVTHIATSDNVEIILPNNQLWNTPVKNYSHNDTRRLDMVFGIGYGDDIDQAMNVISDIISADDRAMDDPEALIAVGELAASSVNITVRIWCQAGDRSALMYDLLKTVKQRFDAEGISIPYPQRDVHLVRENGNTAAWSAHD